MFLNLCSSRLRSIAALILQRFLQLNLIFDINMHHVRFVIVY
jgi:hypothetical protein